MRRIPHRIARRDVGRARGPGHRCRSRFSGRCNPGRGHGSDTFEPGPDVHAKIHTAGAVESKTATTGAKVGQVRTWLGLDDVAGGFYTKGFKLRGVGEHIEVWTATGARRMNGVQVPT